MKIAILGATGLVGKEILRQSLEDPFFESVSIFVRKSAGITHPKLKEYITDYSNLESVSEGFEADAVLCALGTTIKKAGSEENFRKVDFDFVINSARTARQKNAEKFLVVTALGADPDSFIFYNRVKGDTEEELKKMNFKFLGIFRPSLLLGNREEERPGEKAAEFFSGLFSFAFIGFLAKYRPIQAATVAKAMLQAASENSTKLVKIWESDEIEIIGSV